MEKIENLSGQAGRMRKEGRSVHQVGICELCTSSVVHCYSQVQSAFPAVLLSSGQDVQIQGLLSLISGGRAQELSPSHPGDSAP